MPPVDMSHKRALSLLGLQSGQDSAQIDPTKGGRLGLLYSLQASPQDVSPGPARPVLNTGTRILVDFNAELMDNRWEWR